MGCSKLKVVIAVVCVCSCIYVLSIVILTPWACSQIFQRSDCSHVLGLMLAKSSDPLPNHKAADLHNYIAPTTNSLTCGQRQQHTGTDISRIVFGIASASETWARVGGRREYVKQWWKSEMRGFVWLEKEVELEEEVVAAAAGGKSSSTLSRGGSSREYPPFKVSQDTTHFQYTNRWGVLQSLTRHHPHPIHKSVGCPRCTEDFKDCVLGGRPFHPSVPSSIPSSIHPSSSSPKKKMMEEEEEGGGRMAASGVYPNVYVIQPCSL